MIKYNDVQIEYFGKTLDIDYSLYIGSGDGESGPESTLTILSIYLNGTDVSKRIKDYDVIDLVYDKIADNE